MSEYIIYKLNLFRKMFKISSTAHQCKIYHSHKRPNLVRGLITNLPQLSAYLILFKQHLSYIFIKNMGLCLKLIGHEFSLFAYSIWKILRCARSALYT